MIQTIITVWLTCSVIYTAKDLACPYGRDFWFLTFILAPYLAVFEILDEWRSWRSIRKKTNN